MLSLLRRRQAAQEPAAVSPVENHNDSATLREAYAMKNNKRATIVGEVTGGGAHPGDIHRLSAHFMMNVPAGRTISPVTHTDWEVVGVQPDIKVSADDALDQAQLIILKDFLKTEKDPEWRAHLEESIAELD